MSGRTCGTHRKKVDSAAHIKRALHSQGIFLHKPTNNPKSWQPCKGRRCKTAVNGHALYSFSPETLIFRYKHLSRRCTIAPQGQHHTNMQTKDITKKGKLQVKLHNEHTS